MGTGTTLRNNGTTNEIRKTVTLEPFNDFYRTYGSAGRLDRQKLDRSKKETKDTWADTDLKKICNI